MADPIRGFLQNKCYADNTGPAYAYKPSGRLQCPAIALGVTAWAGYQ